MSTTFLSTDNNVRYQLQRSSDSRSQRHAEKSLLGLVGCGIGTSNTALTENTISTLCKTVQATRNNKFTKRWLRVRRTLDSLVRKQDIRGFDESFLRHLNKHSKQIGLDGSRGHDLSLKQRRARFAPEGKRFLLCEACYALRTIFSRQVDMAGTSDSGGSQSVLRINFLPPNVFRWLIHGNYLTPELLSKALQSEELNAQSTKTFKDGDLVRAVIAYDPSLLALSFIMENPSLLSMTDTVLAVKAIISALENCVFHNTVDLDCDNEMDHQQLETEMLRQEEAARLDIDRGLANLEVDLNLLGAMLHKALTRLHSFASDKVSQHLRQYLSKHEIFFLLQLLRIEITEGGWILRYTDLETSLTRYLTSDERAMIIILDLMSSAINALGIAGWLTDSAEKDNIKTGELLLMLQAEISRVLEGVTEATFMSGLLDEFLRYSRRRESMPKYTKSLHLDRQVDSYEGVEEGHAGTLNPKNLLPMGLEANCLSEDTKKGLRGELKKRSKRDVGMQLSMKGRKYSRDRIHL